MLFEVNIASVRLYVRQNFPRCKFESILMKRVPLFAKLISLLLIIRYCKVKSTFHGPSYFIFDRIKRKISMVRNASSIDSVQQSSICWYVFDRIFISEIILVFFDRT